MVGVRPDDLDRVENLERGIEVQRGRAGRDVDSNGVAGEGGVDRLFHRLPDLVRTAVGIAVVGHVLHRRPDEAAPEEGSQIGEAGVSRRVRRFHAAREVLRAGLALGGHRPQQVGELRRPGQADLAVPQRHRLVDRQADRALMAANVRRQRPAGHARRLARRGGGRRRRLVRIPSGDLPGPARVGEIIAYRDRLLARAHDLRRRDQAFELPRQREMELLGDEMERRRLRQAFPGGGELGGDAVQLAQVALLEIGGSGGEDAVDDGRDDGERRRDQDQRAHGVQGALARRDPADDPAEPGRSGWRRGRSVRGRCVCFGQGPPFHDVATIDEPIPSRRRWRLELRPFRLCFFWGFRGSRAAPAKPDQRAVTSASSPVSLFRTLLDPVAVRLILLDTYWISSAILARTWLFELVDRLHHPRDFPPGREGGKHVSV